MTVIFVDDLFIIGGSTSEIKATKAALKARFKMSDFGLCKFFFGMTVIRDCRKQMLRLSQRVYLKTILLDQHHKVVSHDYQR